MPIFFFMYLNTFNTFLAHICVSQKWTKINTPWNVLQKTESTRYFRIGSYQSHTGKETFSALIVLQIVISSSIFNSITLSDCLVYIIDSHSQWSVFNSCQNGRWGCCCASLCIQKMRPWYNAKNPLLPADQMIETEFASRLTLVCITWHR